MLATMGTPECRVVRIEIKEYCIEFKKLYQEFSEIRGKLTATKSKIDLNSYELETFWLTATKFVRTGDMGLWVFFK